jgi:hypothetical protein
VGERRKKSPVSLPQVSNVRVQDFFGQPQVLGEVANSSTSKTLSSLARITFVCLDGAGNVLGGGLTYPPAGLPPGGRGGFSSLVEGALVASQIASVQVSVEPDFD